jgi:hypothetical protein
MKTVKSRRHVAGLPGALAPRNPLVTQVLFRNAGAHGGGRKSERQAAARALRQLIDDR